MKILVETGGGNNAVSFDPVFKTLNAELAKVNKSLVLVCAGGYVMQLHGYRATSDVDAFYGSSAELEAIIRRVGDEFGINKLNELWLNNSLSSMNSEPPVEYCELVHKFSNLEVRAVNITYLIGMKLESARIQDLNDVSAILRHDNNREPFNLRTRLISMGFNIDISLLFEAFEAAHGMDWLEEFYRNNETELLKYL